MSPQRLQSKSLVILILTVIISTASCTTQTEQQVKYGDDADYFIGLRYLEQKEENQARIKFNKCIKKGSYYPAKKSAEILCTFGTIQEKNKAALYLAEKYKDTDSLLTSIQVLKSNNELNKLLELTKHLDYTTDDNRLIKIRLEALQQRGDAAFNSDYYQWFTTRPLSNEHYQFYRDSINHPAFDEIDSLKILQFTNNNNTVQIPEIIYTPEQFVINYRIELYKRNYTYVFENAPVLFEYFEKNTISCIPQLASDIGKAYFYGDANFSKNANFFGEKALSFAGTDAEFYFWFYAGRLFSKANLYSTQAIKSFEKAIECAKTGELKDNALWYLLNVSMNKSFDSITTTIAQYAPQFTNPEYFEDFFETLATSLLAAGKWDAFGKIYKAIDGYATDYDTSQFAYLYGRLSQEKLASGTKTEIEEAFKRALKCDSAIYSYYALLSAYQLGYSDSEVKNLLLAMHSKAPLYSQHSESANLLLEGYADFGFPEKIYSEWKQLKTEGIQNNTAIKCADFLKKCGTDENDFFEQSLRIASDNLLHGGASYTQEQMQLIYPENFKEYVEEACQKYEMESAIIYALIRSESFFNANVESSAGAIGLTQLMELTGGDIARKLKMPEYSLTDPKTNILFGTYYLSEMYQRCNNSIMQAFFSYNAGITRVRRWLQSSLTEFGKKKNMPLDLFLESLPYSETREYGRKLLTATVMYKILYTDSNNSENFNSVFAETVKNLLLF